MESELASINKIATGVDLSWRLVKENLLSLRQKGKVEASGTRAASMWKKKNN